MNSLTGCWHGRGKVEGYHEKASFAAFDGTAFIRLCSPTGKQPTHYSSDHRGNYRTDHRTHYRTDHGTHYRTDHRTYYRTDNGTNYRTYGASAEEAGGHRRGTSGQGQL